ncbi:MAG: transposase [Deltaproteobacteria bacterium]|nr:transposase [Deltaproteobacteria bacterium]
MASRLCIDGEDENTDNEAPSLHDQLGAASIQQLALTGPHAHHPIARFRSRFAAPAEAGTAVKLGRRRARIDGFDLHADTTVRAKSRDRLERLCRYLLRPPLSEERLERCGEQIRLELKSTWRDGTTHLLFEPIELQCGRRAALRFTALPD